jgi:hypothetical protein
MSLEEGAASEAPAYFSSPTGRKLKLSNHKLFFLRGQCDEIFYFRFFHESFSPKPLSSLLGPF